MIRTCPGFERYGIDDNGNIVSSCRGDWIVLAPNKGVLSLHGKRTTTCKIAKFRWCVENQVDPTTLNCTGAVITMDGRIMTRADFLAHRNSYLSKVKANLPLSEKIRKIQTHIEFCQAAIDWLNGKPAKVINLVGANKEAIYSILSCNRSLACDVVDEAEMQLFEALDKGSVIDPYNWLIKRARGILSERKKTLTPFSDEKLKELNNY